MAEAAIDDSVLWCDIDLPLSIKMLNCSQAYLALDRQLPMAKATITDSVPGDNIEL